MRGCTYMNKIETMRDNYAKISIVFLSMSETELGTNVVNSSVMIKKMCGYKMDGIVHFVHTNIEPSLTTFIKTDGLVKDNKENVIVV